jgi:hypothetical protein
MNQTIESKIVKSIESSELRKAISSFVYIDPLKFDIVLYIYREMIHFPKEPVDTMIVYSRPDKYYLSGTEIENKQLYYYLFSCRIKNKNNHLIVSMYTPENEFGVAYFYLQRNFMISLTTSKSSHSVSFSTEEIYDMLSIVFHILLRNRVYLEENVVEDVSIHTSERSKYRSILDRITDEPSRKCKRIIEDFLAIL